MLFRHSTAAVSIDVAIPTPTNNGGQAFTTITCHQVKYKFSNPLHNLSPGINVLPDPGKEQPPPAIYGKISPSSRPGTISHVNKVLYDQYFTRIEFIKCFYTVMTEREHLV